MLIQTEETPNPNSLKFIPGVKVVDEGQQVNIDKKAGANISKLTEQLFEFDFVKSVYLGTDFITITKIEDITWDVIKPDILVTIMEFFVVHQSVLKKKQDSDTDSTSSEDSDVVIQIKSLIETRVRPAVAQDGGDIVYKNFVDGVVMLELHGACSGCPSSSITLKQGIESMLKHYVPEVKAVEAVNE